MTARARPQGPDANTLVIGEKDIRLRRMRALAILVAAAALAPAAVAAPSPTATKAQAITIVKRIVRTNAKPCKLAMRSVVAARIPTGWRVTVRVKVRGGKGFAAWHVKGRVAKPADPFAESISKGCP